MVMVMVVVVIVVVTMVMATSIGKVMIWRYDDYHDDDNLCKTAASSC
jgi:hypothetical protein